jgi:hypothetical protein
LLENITEKRRNFFSNIMKTISVRLMGRIRRAVYEAFTLTRGNVFFVGWGNFFCQTLKTISESDSRGLDAGSG